MGLFDSGASKEAAENEAYLSLSNSPLLDKLMFTITNDATYEWIIKRTGYYDGGVRRVVIGKDMFGVSWQESAIETVDGKTYKLTVKYISNIIDKE